MYSNVQTIFSCIKCFIQKWIPIDFPSRFPFCSDSPPLYLPLSLSLSLFLSFYFSHSISLIRSLSISLSLYLSLSFCVYLSPSFCVFLSLSVCFSLSHGLSVSLLLTFSFSLTSSFPFCLLNMISQRSWLPRYWLGGASWCAWGHEHVHTQSRSHSEVNRSLLSVVCLFFLQFLRFLFLLDRAIFRYFPTPRGISCRCPPLNLLSFSINDLLFFSHCFDYFFRHFILHSLFSCKDPVKLLPSHPHSCFSPPSLSPSSSVLSSLSPSSSVLPSLSHSSSVLSSLSPSPFSHPLLIISSLHSFFYLFYLFHQHPFLLPSSQFFIILKI